jgi:hypothetical protein
VELVWYIQYWCIECFKKNLWCSLVMFASLYIDLNPWNVTPIILFYFWIKFTSPHSVRKIIPESYKKTIRHGQQHTSYQFFLKVSIFTEGNLESRKPFSVQFVSTFHRIIKVNWITISSWFGYAFALEENRWVGHNTQQSWARIKRHICHGVCWNSRQWTSRQWTRWQVSSLHFTIAHEF